MPAKMFTQPPGGLSPDHHGALAQAASTLPDGWTVVAVADAESLTVRIVGLRFAEASGFTRRTPPEQLTAFIERVRREHE